MGHELRALCKSFGFHKKFALFLHLRPFFVKNDRTIVSHINEQQEIELLRLVEVEQLKGNKEATVSSFVRDLISTEINKRRTDYLLLASVFKQNEGNE